MTKKTRLTFYVEHDAGDDQDWPDWQEVGEEMFCALANQYKVDYLGSLWEIMTFQDETTGGLRLMLCPKKG